MQCSKTVEGVVPTPKKDEKKRPEQKLNQSMQT